MAGGFTPGAASSLCRLPGTLSGWGRSEKKGERTFTSEMMSPAPPLDVPRQTYQSINHAFYWVSPAGLLGEKCMLNDAIRL